MNKKEREGKLRQEINDGQKAQMLKDHPFLKEFYEIERAEIMKRLSDHVINRDSEHELVLYAKALTRLEKTLNKRIERGSAARTKLDILLKR